MQKSPQIPAPAYSRLEFTKYNMILIVQSEFEVRESAHSCANHELTEEKKLSYLVGDVRKGAGIDQPDEENNPSPVSECQNDGIRITGCFKPSDCPASKGLVDLGQWSLHKNVKMISHFFYSNIPEWRYRIDLRPVTGLWPSPSQSVLASPEAPGDVVTSCGRCLIVPVSQG